MFGVVHGRADGAPTLHPQRHPREALDMDAAVNLRPVCLASVCCLLAKILVILSKLASETSCSDVRLWPRTSAMIGPFLDIWVSKTAEYIAKHCIHVARSGMCFLEWT